MKSLIIMMNESVPFLHQHQQDVLDAFQAKDGRTNMLQRVRVEHGNITNLYLNRTNLADVPVETWTLRHLSRLWLSDNCISTLPSPTSTEEASGLEWLWMCNNRLVHVPSVVFQHLTSLTQLWLNGNPLIATIPAGISALTNLEKLGVVNCGLRQLPPELGCLLRLDKLDAYGNYLTDIPDALGDLENLTYLALNSNRLTTLTSSIGRLTSLRWLSLNSNLLETLPESIGDLVNLERLSLHMNLLTSIPIALGRCSNLLALSLFKNQLTSLHVGMCAGLHKCTTFSLALNGLTELPADLGRMTSIELLWLQSNRISKVPRGSFGRMPNLQRLWIDNNLFRNVPRDLSLCTRLVDLVVDDDMDSAWVKELMPEVRVGTVAHTG